MSPVSSDPQSPSQFRYAVIIPHYNDLTRLRLCLDRLAPQVAQRDDIETWVVDNNSPIDVSEIPRDYPWLTLCVEQEKGAGKARNRGVRESSAPYLMFTDSDCVPAEDWIASAIAALEEDTIIGGRMETFDETPAPRSGAEAFEAVFAFDQRHYIANLNFTVTANMATSRAVYTGAGDMVFGPSEDLEWCQRAVAKGYKLRYCDEVVVYHPTRKDWEALTKKWRRIVDEQYWANGDHHGTGLMGRMRWLGKAGLVAASALAHSPKVLRSPRLDQSGDRLRALGTLWKLRLVRSYWMLRQALFDRSAA